jgi:hypothetical protein
MRIAPTVTAPKREGEILTRHAVRKPLLLVAVALLLVLAAPHAAATELFTYSLTAAVGVGGSSDAAPGDGFGNTAFQLGFSYITEPHSRLGVRLGRLGLGDGGDFTTLRDADLTYLTFTGEYAFPETYYDAWVFLGLGAYELSGDRRFPSAEESTTAVGAVIGLSTEFELTRKTDVLVEVAGHWADFDDASLFATGLVGVAFHF